MTTAINLLQTIARNLSGTIGRQSWLIEKLRPVYEDLLDKISKQEGIPWQINGVTYRIDPHYRHQLGTDYDASVAAFLRERVKPGAVCLDVGANVGVYVLQFAYWTAPQGRVVAFEPNPATCRVLARHVSLNNLSDRVTIAPFAISSEVGKATFYAYAEDGMSRLGTPNQLIEDRVSAIEVEVTTLDEYCFKQEIYPDWLFIDIEGFEIAALIGARRLIKERRGKMGIIVEMHPNVWDSAQTTRAMAQDLLDSLGVKMVPLTGQKDPLSEYGLVYLSY